jgi:hypothetical protein
LGYFDNTKIIPIAIIIDNNPQPKLKGIERNEV